jgi:Na+/H+-translocating membrane pyrophosphatase
MWTREQKEQMERAHLKAKWEGGILVASFGSWGLILLGGLGGFGGPDHIGIIQSLFVIVAASIVAACFLSIAIPMLNSLMPDDTCKAVVRDRDSLQREVEKRRKINADIARSAAISSHGQIVPIRPEPAAIQLVLPTILPLVLPTIDSATRE